MVSSNNIQCAIQYLDAIKGREADILKAQTDPSIQIRPDVKQVMLDCFHTDEVSSYLLNVPSSMVPIICIQFYNFCLEFFRAAQTMQHSPAAQMSRPFLQIYVENCFLGLICSKIKLSLRNRFCSIINRLHKIRLARSEIEKFIFCKHSIGLFLAS